MNRRKSMSELWIELIAMVGHTTAIRIIEENEEESAEQYAEEMTARWQTE